MDMTINEYKEHRERLKNDPQYALEWKQKKEKELQDYWMELKPFQKAKDVPALPVMNDFYINRLIELGAIPKDKLEDGKWYYGEYRNARLGKWNAETQRFDHYRWKFGWMKDDCNHFQDDDGFALFVPLRLANEIELEEIKKIEQDYGKVVGKR
jgi:hypothetical protein